MTAVTAGPPRAGRELSGAVPLSRLLQVELRKLVDTRSGRWLLISIALLTAAVITLFLFTVDPEELTYANFVDATTAPQSLLLPILGILTVTSEWGQRTGLVTFTLEPHRGRVVVAKIAAAVLLGMAALAIALGLAALANVAGQSLQDGSGSWEFGASGVRDLVVQQLIAVVQGLAYGMLIMNAAGAIVTYFALPTVWSILVATVDAFERIGEWADLGTTGVPLSEHTMDGDAWARLAVSVLIWVGIPLVLGWIRLQRRELRSA